MADQTLSDVFEDLKTRLLAIGKLAIPASVKQTAYVEKESNTYPRLDVFIPTVTRAPDAAPNFATQVFTVNAELRCWVNRFDQAYDGQTQQRMLWEYLPALLQTCEEYRSLRYPGTLTTVPYLNPSLNAITGARCVVIEGEWCIVVSWSIVLRTQFRSKC